MMAPGFWIVARRTAAALSEWVFRIVQERRQENKGPSTFQLLRGNHSNVLSQNRLQLFGHYSTLTDSLAACFTFPCADMVSRIGVTVTADRR